MRIVQFSVALTEQSEGITGHVRQISGAKKLQSHLAGRKSRLPFLLLSARINASTQARSAVVDAKALGLFSTIKYQYQHKNILEIKKG